MNGGRTSRVQNFKSFIDQLIDDYSTEPAKNLIHGFQKDAVQNGWGHRTSDRNWRMTFRYVKNDKGNFIVVEDHANTGLIGKNYTTDEIENLQMTGQLGPNEKLARFSSLFNSGGNTTSAGLFGRGKLMYQAVSENYLEYFDSFTIEGNYVANYVDMNYTNERAYEGQEAINFIYEKTGLPQKKTKGTRIIIANPKKEVVEALLNGTLVKYINETWWLIIKKYNACIEIFDNEELLYTASIPVEYNYEDELHAYTYKNITLDSEYRIKNFGLIYFDEDADEDLVNISYYRNNMKIGNIMDYDLLGLEPKFKNRIAGYIEVDSEWEMKLESNENTTHYGPKSKHATSYQKLKVESLKYLNSFLEMKGLKKKSKRVDPDEELKQLANDLTDFLKDCNLDLDLKTSKNSNNIKPVTVKCNKIYPNDGKRTLEYDQSMKFNFIINKNVVDTNYTVDIVFTSEDGKDKVYKSMNIQFNSNEYTSDIIEIPYNDFFVEQRNIVKIFVSSTTNANTKVSCTFPVYVGKNEDYDFEDIIFRLNDIVLPNAPSRTIRYNEIIEKIELKLINNLNQDFIVGISGFIQDVNDRNNTIDIIYRNPNIEVKKNSEQTIIIENVLFGEKYINKKGPMKIKFKLSHIDGLDYKKAEELKEIFCTILYDEEMLDNNANLFDIHCNNLEDTKIKSRLEHNGDIYDLIFNTDYMMYKFVPQDKNDPFYKEYYLSEMLRTLLIIKFENGDYSFIGCDEDSIKSLTPDELTKRINEFINSYMSQYFEMRV